MTRVQVANNDKSVSNWKWHECELVTDNDKNVS